MDADGSEFAVPDGHGGEELFELANEFLRLPAIRFDHFAEDIIREKSDAIGEEAKEQAHDKASQCLLIDPQLAQVRNQLGEFLRRSFRDANFKSAGLELVWI